MLHAVITICSLAGPCDQVRVPGDFASPVTCAMHAQAYVAETAISVAGRTVRVVCRPTIVAPRHGQVAARR
jgi:hypothetical protein